MANHISLPYDQIPESDEILLAALDDKLRSQNATEDTRETYIYSWRYWMGSASWQAKDWLSLAPDLRFTKAAIDIYFASLNARLGPRGALNTMKLLRIVAGHLCPGADFSYFDAILRDQRETATGCPPPEQHMRLSLSENALPDEDQRRLKVFMTFGRAPDAYSESKPLGGKSREAVRTCYLELNGHVARTKPAALHMPGGSRFTPDLILSFHAETKARLGAGSALYALRRVRYCLSKLWPQVNFGFIEDIIDAIRGKREKLSLSREAFPPGEKQRLARVIEVKSATDQAAILEHRRRGPSKLGQSDATADELWFSVELFYGAASRADPNWIHLPLQRKPTREAISALKDMLIAAHYEAASIAKEFDRTRRVFERLYAVEFDGEKGQVIPHRDDLDWLYDAARDMRSSAVAKPALKPAATTQEAVVSAEKALLRLRRSLEIALTYNKPWRPLKPIAIGYRNALIQLGQALIALRMRSLASIKRDDFICEDAQWALYISAENMKTKAALYRILPKRCYPHLDYFYASVFKLIDPDADESVALPSALGGQITASGLGKSIPATALRTMGKRTRNKDFRSMQATAAVPRKSTAPGIAARNLAHRPDRTETTYESEDDTTALDRLASDIDAMLNDRF